MLDVIHVARRLGVPSVEVVRAMFTGLLPRARRPDGDLGIPAGAVEGFDIDAAGLARGPQLTDLLAIEQFEAHAA